MSGDRLNDGWGCLDDSIRIAYQIIKGQPLSEQLPEPEQKSTQTPIIKDITANNNQVGDNVPLTDKPTKKQAETLPEGEFSDTDVMCKRFLSAFSKFSYFTPAPNIPSLDPNAFVFI